MFRLSTFPIPTVEDPRGNLSFLQKGVLPFAPSGISVNCKKGVAGALIALRGRCTLSTGDETIEASSCRQGVLASSDVNMERSSKDIVLLNVFSVQEEEKMLLKDAKWEEISIDPIKIRAPFNVRRVYYITDIPSLAERGGHSHFRQQVMIMALRGRFRLKLDDGEKNSEIWLKESNRAIFVNAQVWRSMDSFEDDSIALILSSTVYDPSDYIYDYELFKRYSRRTRR
ncbi:MAG: FdtA/QdtA family cupin domain-containing protein [Paramuribaculum sp.]|nr:FdtA/QdtA family cupin domain-containing protein [Paramuribaculum sp.]